MRPIPLNLMTLYADLQQSVALQDTPVGSIAIKTVKGKQYAYLTTKDGSARLEKYLGALSDPEVQEKIAAARDAAERAKSLRNTVSLLKTGRLPAPTLVLGRILEVLANAGLFKQGMTLVGTAAYQTYAGLLGFYAPGAALMTNDVDLSFAEFVPANENQDLETILQRADATFKPVWNATDKLPKAFRSSNGFIVDLLTAFGKGRKTPLPIEGLGVAATALSFQEFAAQETIETVALYGTGVIVRVPAPLRFAVHKLIVAQRRDITQAAKKQKDLRQASELIEIFLKLDEVALQEALDEARNRGKAWQAAINTSLKEIGRTAKQGEPPLLAESETKSAARKKKARTKS